jgi:HEAT repeat protein
MALALADALGEARDRSQRRIFLDALLAHGDLGLEVAQGMVEDPRWFVVRNGVALLGEIGGEDRVSYLTGPLANPDSRVRKETVLALSKIDGENARLLLLGMLDDPDPDVRAVACRAVGLLKMEKALRPLLKILDEDNHENVQVECLEALGKIEDPGAVPFIEKRAVGGLFSRPTTEIRVAAYRALAGIGTPRAKTLLKKAVTDSDPEVRSVAQSLMV